MNLRDLAAADHRLIVGDAADGFAREITLVSPDGRQATVNGFWNDIGQGIDLQSGALVAGRQAFVRLTMQSLRNAGFEKLPRGVVDGEPWLVRYVGLGGREQRAKVSDFRPDRTFDAVDLYLEPHT